MNAVLGSCKYGKCVRCTFDSSVYCLYVYALRHCWALSIRILICHRLSVLDRRVQTQAISDPFSDRTIRWFGWDTSPTLLRTLSPRRNPRDLPARRRRRQHRRRRGGGGGDARVPRAMPVPGMARGPTCAGPGSAAPLGTRMHISANSAEPHMH
jgi:hypothetical protein